MMNQNQPSRALHLWENEKTFRDTMHHAGIEVSGAIVRDGKIHRFETHKRGHKDGYYAFHGMAGVFGDWSRDIHEKWSINTDHINYQDKEAFYEQIEQVKQAADAERQRKQEETAVIAVAKWNDCAEIGCSPYLEKKRVNAYGIRFNNDCLLVPLRDVSSKLWSLQWINADGSKRFLSGGRKKGCFHTIGALENGKTIMVAEGYATGASIHMATHQPTVIAFDAGNLEPVIEELRQAYPKSPVLIAGDDDRWKEKNIGREISEEAARKYNCRVVFPKFKDISAKPTDFNDLMTLEGIEEVKNQINAALKETTIKALNLRELLSLEIKPREMILDPIIPEQGLVMIHAPRGIGKTQVSLLIAYSVATGSPMFDGKWHSPKANKVLFVDGEMPLTVMQDRLAKIVQSGAREIRNDDDLLIITPDIQEKGLTDLSTPEGQRIIEEHLNGVKLLILDNYSSLCRSGRENESESWIPLQEWFLTLRRRGISVLLIHHSNKNGGQRGTSRKEDLLDTVITLRRSENYDPRDGARFEVHYEKARGFYGDAATPFEAHLREEKGKLSWSIQNLENAQMQEILTLHKENLSQRKIANELGLSVATINRRLKEAKERDG